MEKNESGFVLIELTVVLLIVSIMILIPTLSIDKMIESTQVDSFFQELSANVTLMQNHAILNDEATQVQFYKGSKGDVIDFKVIGSSEHPLNRKMVLDSEHYSLSTSLADFRFLKGTGNISKSGTVNFNTSKGSYSFTYWLGSGRFEIRQ